MYVYCIMIKEMLNKKKWIDQEKLLMFLIGVLPPNNFTDFSKNLKKVINRKISINM